jgi:hypothetical protein
VVGAAVLFGLVVLWPERADVWYPNDASVHASMVRWAADRIREGHLPLDGWYPYLSLGASRFHHYQSLPHVVTGAISAVLGAGVFRWSLYLLLATWPIAVYAGARLLGLGRWPAACAAVVSPLLNSEPGLGYEWGSYVWRGSGTWAQLWGMWALPFAWGLSWRAVAKGERLWLAAVAVGLTVCLHLLTGYLALLTLGVWVLTRPRELPRRVVRAAVVGAGALAVAGWMLVPLVQDAAWTVNDEFSRGTIYYDSFGASRILSWLASGEIFDEARIPVVTVLTGAGLAVAVVGWLRREPPRAVVGAGLLSLLLFFGRPTLGPLVDLLPGGEDLFLRRFVSGVHLAGIYLAGLGLTWVGAALTRLLRRRDAVPRWARVAAAPAIASIALVPIAVERASYEAQGARWIQDQLVAQARDGVDFAELVARAGGEGPGRVFAGLRAAGATAPRIGQVPGYIALLSLDADAVGFTRPTWSLMSPAEYRFDIRDPGRRRIFGVRYWVRPSQPIVPEGAVEVATAGRWSLYRFDDVGYVQVIDTVPAIPGDREHLGQLTSFVLRSGLPDRSILPTVSFDGRPGGPSTLRPHELPAAPPGEVVETLAGPSDGTFSARVVMDRPGVVMLAASFDPRWEAVLDDHAAPVFMVAPGVPGVLVPEGEHALLFTYRTYGNYASLIVIAALALLGIWGVQKRLRHRASTQEATPDA